MPDISDLKLERYVLGELPAEERRALKARLKTDAALRERLSALEKSTAALLRETPPEVFAARLLARQRRRAAEAKALARTASSAYGFAAWKPLLGSAVLLVILAVPLTRLMGPRDPGLAVDETATTGIPSSGTEGVGQSTQDPPARSPSEAPPEASPAVPVETPIAAVQDDGIRLKGLEPHLAIFRKTGSGAEPLHPGEKARAGELLRIGYQAGGFPYGAILSVDGNGSVTRHWPATGTTAGKLENGEALLPSSFELDAAPDYERFYFVVSKRPFALDPLLQSLHANESLPDAKNIKGGETRIVRFEILKESGI
jgi:hypothetical protein